MTENEVASQIVDAAYKIHTEIGPGLLESVYEAVMADELTRRGSASCVSKLSLWCMVTLSSTSDSVPISW